MAKMQAPQLQPVNPDSAAPKQRGRPPCSKNMKKRGGRPLGSKRPSTAASEGLGLRASAGAGQSQALVPPLGTVARPAQMRQGQDPRLQHAVSKPAHTAAAPVGLMPSPQQPPPPTVTQPVALQRELPSPAAPARRAGGAASEVAPSQLPQDRDQEAAGEGGEAEEMPAQLQSGRCPAAGGQPDERRAADSTRWLAVAHSPQQAASAAAILTAPHTGLVAAGYGAVASAEAADDPELAVWQLADALERRLAPGAHYTDVQRLASQVTRSRSFPVCADHNLEQLYQDVSASICEGGADVDWTAAGFIVSIRAGS